MITMRNFLLMEYKLITLPRSESLFNFGIIMIFILILSSAFALSHGATSPGCQSISYKKLDLMFLLDGSGSVGKKNFPKVLDFVKKVVSRLPIGASETAVGVIQYTLVPKNRSDLNGFKPRNEITLNSVKNRDQLVEKIGKIKYIGGATRIIGAISAAYKQFAIHGRSGVPKALVIITDGVTKEDVKKASDRMRLTGATIISVGVGQAVQDQLLLMAGHSSRVFSVNKFNQMVKFVDKLAMTIQKAIDPRCYGEFEVSFDSKPKGPFRVGQKIELTCYYGGRNTQSALFKDGKPFEHNGEGSIAATTSRFYYTFTASAKTAGVYECQAVSDSGIVIFSRKIYVLKQMEDDSDLDEDIGGTDIFSPSIKDVSPHILCRRCPTDRCTINDGDQCTEEYLDCWNMASPAGLLKCPPNMLFTVESVQRNISGNCWSATECERQKLMFWK